MTPRRVLIAAAIALTCLASAATAQADDPPRFGIGAQAGLPWGSAPFPVGISARLRITRLQSIAAGIGAPIPTLGLGVWGDYQLSADLGFLSATLRDVEVYGGLGSQVGFLGPSYYARKYNSYVGFQYLYSSNGEFAIALRTPVGVRALFVQRHIEVFAECETTFLVVPSREFLLGSVFGFRYYF